jgi:hypothetical protein
MAIFCIEEFKTEYDKLIKSKSYSTLEKDLIIYFFDKPIEELLSGSRLNGSNENPYIKKRLKGSGGYRFYFLVIVKDNNLYLMFVHPKTGSFGYDNVKDESKAYLYKTVLDAIKNKNYYRLEVVDEKLTFLKHTI